MEGETAWEVKGGEDREITFRGDWRTQNSDEEIELRGSRVLPSYLPFTAQIPHQERSYFRVYHLPHLRTSLLLLYFLF